MLKAITLFVIGLCIAGMFAVDAVRKGTRRALKRVAVRVRR